jgi:hypothetical protein
MLVLLLVMLLSIMATPVLAVQPKDVVSFNTSTIITPFWENTASAQANISSSNQTLKPSTYILAKNPSTSISGTLYLERKSGSNWQHVTSWPNPNRYYIQFLNYGTIDYGYVDRNAVRIPSTNWSRPITTGYISADYSPGVHNGIDVAAAAGTRINAVTNVQHRSRIYRGTVNGVTHLVNFGNYVDGNTGTYQVIYAHMSAFSYGTADTTTPSYRSRYTGAETITTVATFTPSAGAKIGEVGNIGGLLAIICT